MIVLFYICCLLILVEVPEIKGKLETTWSGKNINTYNCCSWVIMNLHCLYFLSFIPLVWLGGLLYQCMHCTQKFWVLLKLLGFAVMLISQEFDPTTPEIDSWFVRQLGATCDVDYGYPQSTDYLIYSAIFRLYYVLSPGSCLETISHVYVSQFLLLSFLHNSQNHKKA